MRCGLTAALMAIAFGVLAPERSAAQGSLQTGVPQIATNDNTAPAGVLRAGRLEVSLVARDGSWHPDGPGTLGLPIGAFGEVGKPLALPGPLLRVPAGTPVVVRLRNALRGETLHVYGLNGSQNGAVVMSPGTSHTFRFVRKVPGTYRYWAVDRAESQRMQGSHDAGLSGAIVVDDPRHARPHDRVFVLGVWINVFRKDGSPNFRYELDTINGRSWPATERLSYPRGADVAWRIVNASLGEHPLHLHGFPFVVDSEGNGLEQISLSNRPAIREVTHLVEPGDTFSMHWHATRAGLWLFHCHFTGHTMQHAPLEAMAAGKAISTYHFADANHRPGDSMGGMMLALRIAAAPGGRAAMPPVPQHTLALDISKAADPTANGLTGTFAYSELDRGVAVASPGRIGPLIVLTAGEPTAIAVTNHLAEATSVHWHGIEVQNSVDDGAAMMAGMAPVPGFAPAIEPGTTFTAQFTPPQAGTFMYHTHMDDVWQLLSGLCGPIVVMPPGLRYDPATDHVVMLSVDDEHAGGDRVRVNGQLEPPAIVVHAGQSQRIRLLNLTLINADLVVSLDGMPAQLWTPIAKDGYDLDPRLQIPRRPTQEITIGETRDFRFLPATVGSASLDVFEEGTKVATLPIDVVP